MNKLPLYCPSCQNKLKVKSLSCEKCNTSVEGLYSLPTLISLNIEDQQFIVNFVKFSGSLKDMAKHLNLSYPTVRNLLDEIIIKIYNLEKEKNSNKK
jgi:hypothetical protein